MYYICRFSDNWTLYDTNTKKSRQLTKEEVALLQNLFAGLLNDQTRIFNAVKVEAISPNKLLSLPMGVK